MKSVILISPNNKEIIHLFQQWENKATNMYVNNENPKQHSAQLKNVHIDILD